MLKGYVQKRLENYVIRYFAKHPDVKLVAVTGSIGKTGTKRAIATVLSRRFRVGMHDDTSSTHLTVPLSILGIVYPEKPHSPLAWHRVFSAARQRIQSPTTVDVIIQELNANRPGDISSYSRYLRPDISVITGITPERIESFQSIDILAAEEMALNQFSGQVLINRDDIDAKYAAMLVNPSINTYGTTGFAEYRFEISEFTLNGGYVGSVIAPEYPNPIDAQAKVIGEHSLRPIMAAVAVATKMQMLPEEIANGIAAITATPGRMNLLDGIGDTHIIDDTASSSPGSALAALQALYAIDAPQRIAILGSMSGLGNVSADEHKKIGAECNPDLLSWVITVGKDANQYLGPEARARGCQVKAFDSAIDAGAFVRSVSDEGAVILAKGSKNGIYLEEAVKVLCEMSEDIELVRQTPEYMEIKNNFFSKFS